MDYMKLADELEIDSSSPQEKAIYTVWFKKRIFDYEMREKPLTNPEKTL